MEHTLKLALITALALLLSACGSGDTRTTQEHRELPSTPFTPLADYALAEFSNDSALLHLEIRRSPVQGPMTLPEEFEVLFSYSVPELTLTEAQQTLLATTDSDTGFFNLCLPMDCAAYAVTLTEDEARALNTTAKLMAWLDNLDTEAKLHLWLYAHQYQALYYTSVDGGYRVIGGWDDLCGKRGEDLLFIDHNGVITLLDNLKTEATSGCV